MGKKEVFLSHSSRDVVLTRLIGHLVERKGLKCFYSERNTPLGGDLLGMIAAIAVAFRHAPWK